MNLDNPCFMNSVPQALTYCTPIDSPIDSSTDTPLSLINRNSKLVMNHNNKLNGLIHKELDVAVSKDVKRELDDMHLNLLGKSGKF